MTNPDIQKKIEEKVQYLTEGMDTFIPSDFEYMGLSGAEYFRKQLFQALTEMYEMGRQDEKAEWQKEVPIIHESFKQPIKEMHLTKRGWIFADDVELYYSIFRL
jgi:hypothetical protein